MKQFLLVLDNEIPCFETIEKGILCARSANAFLTTLIIAHTPPETAPSYPFPNDWALTFGEESRQLLAAEAADLLEQNKQLIRDCCKAAEQPFEILEEHIGLADLVMRTKFVDCLLCDGKLSPERFHITDLLIQSYCPVYLIGSQPVPPKRIALAYDGTAASMMAARAYSQLFPPGDRYDCLHFTERESSLPHRAELENWLQKHYPGGTIVCRIENLESGLVNWHAENNTDLVIMGSYGRGAVSRFFRHSLAAHLVEKGGQGLFLWHSRRE